MISTKRCYFYLFIFCTVIYFVNAKSKLSGTKEQLSGVIKTHGTSVTKNAVVGRIIDAPTLACPDGQKKDFRGKCRKEI